MAHHLYVTVRWNGAVVEQRLCVVRDEMWLGQAPGAEVAFPGPSLRVRRVGERLQVQGRWLDVGAPVRMTRDGLEVQLEALEVGVRERFGAIDVPDVRLLFASAAIILLGAWWEAVGAFLDRHPSAIAQVSAAAQVVRAEGPALTLPARLDATGLGERVAPGGELAGSETSATVGGVIAQHTDSTTEPVAESTGDDDAPVGIPVRFDGALPEPTAARP